MENILRARSPRLMSSHDTGLLVIDVQERLVPHIHDHARVVWNIRRLVDGARILGVSAAGTEQYPQGMGPTVGELAERLGPFEQKMAFSAAACPALFRRWKDAGINKVLITGIESHVCVAQTALDLLAESWRVYLAADAVGSRSPEDKRVALERMAQEGVVLTTTEAALFEWCVVSGTPQFKQISKLVRETAPG